VFSAPAQFLGGQTSPLQLPQKASPSGGDGGPGGAFGLALNVLDFGRAGIVSGFKESIDLLQDIKRGELGSGEFSPSEWWNQATSHYGFGDLIHDERQAVGLGLMLAAPLTAGLGPVLGAAVLADNIWADRVIGFVGDVAVDPLTYMGGFNAVIRGVRATRMLTHLDDFAALGAKGVKALAKDAGRSVSDDVANKMVKVAGEAIGAGGKGKSLSSMARQLRKTDEGKLVAELMGLDPGLRARMPGTGPLGRVMRQDRILEKVGMDVAGRQARQIPRFFKSGHSDDAWDAAVRAFRPSGSAAAREAVPKGMREAAGLAARAPVEFVLPGGIKGAARAGLGASLIARVTDVPIRGTNKLNTLTGDRLSAMFNPDSYLNPMMASGNPAKVATAARVKDFMRHGRAKESFFTRSIDTAMEAATRRGVGRKVSDESMVDLMEYANALVRDVDGVYDNIFSNKGQVLRDENNLWYRNLPDDVKSLSDEEFFVLARDLDRWVQTATQHTADAYGPTWAATIKQLEVEEGGVWRGPRRLTTNARRRFEWGTETSSAGRVSDVDPDFFDASTKSGGRRSELHYEASGRFEPASTKKRLYKIGSNVTLHDVSGAADDSIERVVKRNGKGFDNVLKDLATGEVFKVQDPNAVGKSIRRQIDEVYEAAFGERMFEDKFSTLADAWKRGMARDLRVEHFMNRLREVFPTERLDDIIGDIEQSLDQYTVAEQRWKRADKSLKTLTKKRDREFAKAATAAGHASDKSTAVIAGDLKGDEIISTIRNIDGQMLDLRAELTEIESVLGAAGVKLDELSPTLKQVGDLEAKYGAEAQSAIAGADAAAARVAEIENAMTEFARLRRRMEDLVRDEIGRGAGPLIDDMETARVAYTAALDEHRELSVAANQYAAEVASLIADIERRAPQISSAADDARRLMDVADVAEVEAAQVRRVPPSEVDMRAEVVAAVEELEAARHTLRNAETTSRIFREAAASLEAEAVDAAKRLKRTKLGGTLTTTDEALKAYNKLVAVEDKAAKALEDARKEADKVIAKISGEPDAGSQLAKEEYNQLVTARMKVYERPEPRFESLGPQPRDPNAGAVPEGLRVFDDGVAAAENVAKAETVEASARRAVDRAGVNYQAAIEAEVFDGGATRALALSKRAEIGGYIEEVEERILAEQIRLDSAKRSTLAETRSLMKQQRWLDDIEVLKTARSKIEIPATTLEQAETSLRIAENKHGEAVKALKELKNEPAFNLREAVRAQLIKEGVLEPEKTYTHHQFRRVRAQRRKVEKAQAAYKATQSHQLRGDRERLGNFVAANSLWRDIVDPPPGQMFTREDGTVMTFFSKDRSKLSQANVKERLAAEAVDARTVALRSERELSAAKGRLVKIVGDTNPLLSTRADLFAQSANDGPVGIVRIQMRSQQIVPDPKSPRGFVRPGGEREVYLRVRRVRSGEWKFTHLAKDLQGDALKVGMRRGGDVRRELSEAGWRMFDESGPLGNAPKSDRLFAAEQRVRHLKQNAAFSKEATPAQLEHRVLRLREAEREVEALSDELLSPAERASKARSAAHRGERTLEVLSDAQSASEGTLKRLQTAPVEQPAPWWEVMFPDRQNLIDAFEENVAALDEQIEFIRKEVLPLLAAKGTLLAGDDATVRAMRQLLNELKHDVVRSGGKSAPNVRMDKWIDLVKRFEGVDRVLQHERFVAAGRVVDDDGSINGMAALRRSEKELGEFNVKFEAAAKKAGVSTRRVPRGDTGYEVAETFLSGEKLTDLRERIEVGQMLQRKYDRAVTQQRSNVERLATATTEGNVFEAKRVEKLLKANELEGEVAALEAGEWTRTFHEALSTAGAMTDVDKKIGTLLNSLETRAQRVGTRVKPVRVKGQIVEPGAQIGRGGKRAEFADTLTGAMERYGYVADESKKSLFKLNAPEREQARALLSDALTSSEWGPWRLISADHTLNKEVGAVINAYARINDPKEWGLFWKSWDKTQTWLKASMIATPGFVNRNIFGAFFNAWLDGVNLNEIRHSMQMTMRASKKALNDQTSVLVAAETLAKSDPSFNNYVELLRVGVRGGGQAVDAVELEYGLRNARSLEMLVGGRKTVGGKQTGVSFKPWSPRFAPFQAVRSVNSWVEDIVRLGVGMDTLRWGGTTDDALERIAKSQFDYDELTSWERDWAKRFIPFYTWTRKNVPYQLKQLAAHPEKYNRLLAAKRNLELGTEEENVVPDYYLRPFGIRLPFSFRGGRVYSAPDLPFQDLARYGGKRGVKGALQELASATSPIMKTPLEAYFGKQIFTGIPFTGRYQQAPAPISSIPGVMEALGVAKLAKKNRRGEWRMRDHDIYVVMGLLPTIGLIRRMFPNEERYQRSQIRTLLSTLGGVGVQFNTPQVQSDWLKNQRYEVLDDRQDRKDLEMRRK
jgi:hypothetical protein